MIVDNVYTYKKKKKKKEENLHQKMISKSGADPEVRHNNTEENILYYIWKYYNDFTLLQ